MNDHAPVSVHILRVPNRILLNISWDDQSVWENEPINPIGEWDFLGRLTIIREGPTLHASRPNLTSR